MRKTLALAAGVVLLTTPAVAAGPSAACTGPSYTFSSPAALAPSAQLLGNGDALVLRSDAAELRSAADGALRYPVAVPDTGALVVDPARGSSGRTEGSILELQQKACPTLGVTRLSSRQAQVLPGLAVADGNHLSLLGVGAGVLGRASAAAVETRADDDPSLERNYYNIRYRDATPVPMRGSVDVFDSGTGGSLLHLVKPQGLGPGPISGFYPTSRGGTFVAMLASRGTGADLKTTVVSYFGRRRQWTATIPTLPQPGLFLPLSRGPAFVTASFLSAAGVTTTVVTNRISALEESTGRLLWSLDLPPSPAVFIYEVKGDVLVDDWIAGVVRRYSGATGTLRWSTSYRATGGQYHRPSSTLLPVTDALPVPLIVDLASGATASAPVLLDGPIWPGVDLSGDGTADWLQSVETGYNPHANTPSQYTGMIRVLDGKTLAVLWTAKTAMGPRPNITSSITGVGRRVAALVGDAITMFDGRTGSTLWQR